MKKCPVCHRPLKHYCHHHFYWPKANYKSNFTIKVHRHCEQAYHAYFTENCVTGEVGCRGCRFTDICYRRNYEI